MYHNTIKLLSFSNFQIKTNVFIWYNRRTETVVSEKKYCFPDRQKITYILICYILNTEGILLIKYYNKDNIRC